MAGKKASITVEILGESKGAVDAAKDTEDAYSSLGKKMSGFGAGIGAAVGTLAANMGQDLLAAAGGWVNLAKEAEIFDKKAGVVFGDSATDVKKWADGVNESFGVSDEAVVGMAASMGDLLVPLGFTREAAADMSMQMVDLSGALSAWSGGTVSAAEVSDIMTKAMLGETDGLKALGISISADEVARKAAQMAAEGQTFATEEQAKAAATQALIMEKSTDAQTAWTDGTMDSVKQQNEMSAAWADAQVMLGQVLLPIVQQATAFFVEKLIPAAKKVGEVIAGAFTWLIENKPILIGALTAFGVLVAAILVPAFVAWAATAGAAAIATLTALAPIIAVGAALAALVAGVIWAYQNWEFFRTTVDAVRAWIVETLLPTLQNVFYWLRDNVPPIMEAIVSAFQTAWDTIKSVVETVLGAIRLLWDTFGTYITEAAIAVWGAIAGVVQAGIDFVKAIIDGVMALIKGDWDGVWAAIKAGLQAVWDGIKALVSGALDSVKATIAAAWTAVGLAASTAWDGIKKTISGVWDGIKTTVSDAVTAIVDTITGLPGKLLGLVTSMTSAGASIGKAILTGIGNGISGAVGFFSDIASAVKSGIVSAANSIIDKVNSALEFTINGPGFLPDIHLDPPNLPHLSFHTGGIVPGPIGADVPATLQAGEGVFTRDQMDALGGGIGLSHITVQIGEHEFIARVIKPELERRDADTVSRARAGVRV